MSNVSTDSVSLGPTIPARAQRAVPLRRFAYAVAAVAVFTSVVGALHMPFAAPLLRRVSPAAVCPVQRGTPEQVDRAHTLSAAAKAKTTTAAPARFAMGFELDRTTRRDVAAWGEKNRLSCSKLAGNESLIRCVDVPVSAFEASSAAAVEGVGAYEDVSFVFRSTGELVNVQARRRHLSADAASKLAASLSLRAEHALGAPTTVGGDPTAAHLSRGALSTYVAEFAFSDYEATVAATNLPPHGVMVREQYISLRR